MILTLLLLSLLPAQTIRTVCASGCTQPLTAVGLQAAIDASTFGDIVQITAGQTVSVGANRILLRNKGACTAQITIRSSAVHQLTPGARVTAADAPYMAKVYADTGSTAVFGNEQGAECYRLHGLEITAHAGFPASRALIAFGTETPVSNGVADSHPSQLPDNITIEQCWLHAHPASVGGPRRGIMAHTRKLEVLNTLIDEIWVDGNESNAIGGWNGKGPFYVKNNRLSSAAITTLFGGALPNIRGIRANGLFFEGNHYYRPWKWRKREMATDPSGACMDDSNGGEFWKNTATSSYWQCVGGTWTSILAAAYPIINFYQKNIFELKNAWRAWIKRNVLENAWQPAAFNQVGAMFLMNLVDNDPGQPGLDEKSATVGHVYITNNYGRRAPHLMILGYIGSYWTGFNNITVENNVFDQIGDAPFTTTGVSGEYKGGGGLLWVPEIADNLQYTRNTLISRNPVQAKAVSLFGSNTTSQPTKVLISGNIMPWNQDGFRQDGDAGNLWMALPKIPSNSLADGSAVSRNAIINNLSLTYGSRAFPIANLAWIGGGPFATAVACPASLFDNTGAGSATNGDCAFPGAYTDMGFTTYPGTSPTSYKLASGPYRGWGPGGQDVGADTDLVSLLTSEVSSDAATLPNVLEVGRVWPTSQSAISFRYTAPSTSSCTLTLSTRPNLSSPIVNELSDNGGDLARLQAGINTLAANTNYYWRITCGSQYRRGQAKTLP